IDVQKEVTPINADAGDTVTYTVTITNVGAGMAYDAYFDENLDDNTDYVLGSLVCEITDASAGTVTPTTAQFDFLPANGIPDAPTTTMDQFRIANTASEVTNTWDLDTNDSVTCRYAVTLNDTAPTGATGANALSNAVTGAFDS